ncbi:MAG: M23 family metallopeptidase, partial [bacterium]|nr:M23 family metallopeptidase [bacterium]
IDFAMPLGTPVYAAEGGSVTFSGPARNAGNTIVIQNSDSLTYRYMHNNTLLYRAGQSVNAGDQITLSGNTGQSSGPHLHFDVR